MLEGQNTSQTLEAPGYRSKEHKKTFTIAVGILGAVFLLAQFIVPFVIMIVAMPTFMVSGIFSMKEANPARSDYWNGRVWYPEAQVNFDASSGTVPHLKALVNLGDLGLGGTRISDEGRKELQNALPKCWFEFERCSPSPCPC